MEELHGERIVDPYRWLEDGANPETCAWTEAQNAYTRTVLDAWPGRSLLRKRLDELLTAGAVGVPTQRGARYFYTRREGRQDQPVLLLREGVSGAERVLIDPNALSARGVVALDWWHPSWDGRFVAYGTSRGGDELSTLRVLDVDRGEPVPGEEIPHTRACSVAWLPDGRGFYYTRYPEPGSVAEGEEHYHRHVYLHLLGADWRSDPRVFGEGRAREDWPELQLSRDGRWLLVTVAQGWARSEVYLLDRTRPEAGFVPVHAGSESWADGEVAGGRLFLRTNRDAPNYTLFEVDPEQPAREHWRQLIPERPDRVLNTVRAVAGRLAVEELERASSRLRVYRLDGTFEREVALPSLGTLVGIEGEPEGDAILYGFTSFAHPPTAYRLARDAGAPTLFAEGALPRGLDPASYAVRQVWYRSRDGTRVSMFLVHPRGLHPDGQRPTLLTGYGGFNVSRLPAFDPALPLWLDAGGVFALANLRGGGEYGEAWHQAGMLDRKQNVFDDFVAAAEWLIAPPLDRGSTSPGSAAAHEPSARWTEDDAPGGYTRPERLGIVGGSNGGLLAGAALTQRPDLFGAVVCRVPLLDMLRYHRLRIARLWIPEYGSPEDPRAFQWLRAYSPYHHVREGTRYPATLLLTAEGDSRVDPMHARKMAARLQAVAPSAGDDPSGRAPVLLRVETEAGHGQGKPRGKVLDEQTDIWSFLFWQLEVPFPTTADPPHRAS